jgi:hypothetical protein
MPEFTGEYPPAWDTLKHEVRAAAGNRCVRCGHPYPPGESGGKWTPCDKDCWHGGPYKIRHGFGRTESIVLTTPLVGWAFAQHHEYDLDPPFVYARYRILTVHHLDSDKSNLRWWNLLSLCQICHLEIQGKVDLHQPYGMFDHSPWFKPYVAGWYAHHYLNLELSREEIMPDLEWWATLEMRMP